MQRTEPASPADLGYVGPPVKRTPGDPQDACPLGIVDLRISGDPWRYLGDRNQTASDLARDWIQRSSVLNLSFQLRRSKVVLLYFHVSQITGGSSSSGGWGTFVNIFTGFANDDVGRHASRSSAVTKVDFQGVVGGHSR